MADLVLAQAPAEKDVLAFPLRWKVDEAGVEVLHERARFVDPRHAARDAGHFLVEGLLHVLQLARLEVASVAGDPSRHDRLALL